MSLLIKGIDLPEDAGSLDLIVDDKKGNYLTDYEILLTEVIQIPTPHGRLIDADKVFCYDFWDEQNIDNAPTIIEAED